MASSASAKAGTTASQPYACGVSSTTDAAEWPGRGTARAQDRPDQSGPETVQRPHGHRRAPLLIEIGGKVYDGVMGRFYDPADYLAKLLAVPIWRLRPDEVFSQL